MVKEYLKELGITVELTEEQAIKMLIDSHKRQYDIVKTHIRLMAYLKCSFLGRMLLKNFE